MRPQRLRPGRYRSTARAGRDRRVSRWWAGELLPAHEHLASAVVRRVLGCVIDDAEPLESVPRIVIGTRAGQVHEFGALFVEGWPRCGASFTSSGSTRARLYPFHASIFQGMLRAHSERGTRYDVIPRTMAPTTPAEESLIPELRARRRDFELAREEAGEVVAGLSEDEFNRRPGPDRWSIAECIGHLITTGVAVVPYLEKGIEKGRARGWQSDGPFSYGRIGDWFVRLTGDEQLPPRWRIPSPPVFRPAPGPRRTSRQTLEAFGGLQDQLIDLVHRSNGLDLARIRCRSAVTSLLRLSLGQWLRMLAGHQRRHLWQARKVRDALGEGG